MRSIKDKTVVITGASQGIGEATARLFAAEGSKIVLCSRNHARLEKVAASLPLDKKNYLTVIADIQKAAGMKKIITAAIKKFKRIDIFVNNAGVGISKPILELTEKEYDQIFNTNLKAVFHSFKELIPIMKKQGQGQIINISSGAGRIGMPGIAAYSASKAALNAFSEAVAGEVRADNIKISILSPASTDTRFMTNMSKKSISPSKAKKKLTTGEVAEAVIFLAKQNENAWTSMADIRPLQIRK